MLGVGLVQKEILKLMEDFEPWFLLYFDLEKTFIYVLF